MPNRPAETVGLNTRPIDRLRAAAAVLQASGNPDAAWLAQGIAAYRDAAPMGDTLDTVLGLARAAGAGTWWAQEARQRRDAALRLLCDDGAFAGLGITAAAEAVAKVVNRRARSSAPPATKRDALADAVLRSGAKLPRPRHLIAILRK